MKIALIGNPNTGKSSVFNLLTGLRQHVGNFAGVTVDKKTGSWKIGNETHELIDFPGIYSIYPRTKDEEVVYKVLSNPKDENFPDLALIVLDASNLKRNLLLCTQILDLQIPSIVILNMWDVNKKRGIQVDADLLSEKLGVSVIPFVARVGLGKGRLEKEIEQKKSVATKFPTIHHFELKNLNDEVGKQQESVFRFDKIQALVKQVEQVKHSKTDEVSRSLDKWLTHPVFGYFLFLFILAVVFQFIFYFASYPMDFIDEKFGHLSTWLASFLPEGLFVDLLTQGIVPGVGGVLIFVPQIALLFFFISLLEESGYLSRVVFIMDRLMRPFGLNGKSVVPLMSSVACAIPGVMATRTISDWKERLITILVAPLMSCSARIPVYTLLIALVIPNKVVGGIFQLQGLVLLGLYLLGIVAALLLSILLKQFITNKSPGFLLMEMPGYKMPQWKNVGLTVWEKVRVFIMDAGKIILAISIVLWALANFSPSGASERAIRDLTKSEVFQNANQETKTQLIAATKIEQSYIGHLGRWIEPVIKPLGYDWKIGIALITSFAAREVFVGSLSTIYAVESQDDNQSLLERMKSERHRDGRPVFSLASGLSLMVFYVFAMQCMATLAVVKRETKSWRWPLFQLFFMGALAYSAAFLVFVVFS
jgi:ferrous iron transport protein B